jgi:hypothetical protein
VKVSKEGGSAQIKQNSNGGPPGRAPNGQILPGTVIPGVGRKPKAVEKAYLDAIRNALPPEQMESVIAEALQLARDTRSWRGLLEVVQFAASYGAGKPTQKMVTTDGNLEQLLAALSSDVPLLPAVDKQAEEQQGNKTII